MKPQPTVAPTFLRLAPITEPRGATAVATDDFSVCAADEPIPIRDVHATLLNLLSLDDEQITYHYAGRIRRRTDIGGEVRGQIFS
ncbi:MAG: DUF1501 domain-containing protein [Pedosphaera sp.]|nr:DUF1501 domain-containing protein [Pedosphaera sp.]